VDGAVRVWRDEMGPGNRERYDRPEMFSALMLPPQPKPRPSSEGSKRSPLRGPPKRVSVTSKPILARLSLSRPQFPLLPDVIAEIIWLYLDKPDLSPISELLKHIGAKQGKNSVCRLS